MGRLLFSIGLVVIGIFIGTMIRLIVSKGYINLSMSSTRITLQKIALLVLNPIAIIGATWITDISSLKIVSLPFLGMTALITGGLLAFFIAKSLRFRSKQTGSYTVCGGFTNIGSLGALFCFLFLGEKGFALVPFYKLFEETLYYAVGFPIAKSFSEDISENLPFIKRFKDAFTDKFVMVAVTSIGVGLILNLSGFNRPDIYFTINAILIPLASLLLLISIGMAMQFSSVKTYFKPGLLIAAIKFVLLPGIVFILGSVIGLNQIDDGLPLKAALILSSMPVGFIAMVPPTLYKLDIELSNACWLITNTILLIYLPFLYFMVQRI
jgi:predicted permease